MIKNLLIFIDAFPNRFLDDAPFLSSFDYRARVLPGLGYSVNIKSEIFGGYSPDRAGFFNLWSYTRNSTYEKHHWWLRGLAPLSWHPFLDRFSHRVLSKIMRQDIFNIPYPYLRYFTHYGTNPYEEGYEKDTLFTLAPSVHKITYSQAPRSVKNKDAWALDRASDYINRAETDELLFIALADLDHITHRYGFGGLEQRQKIEELDGELKAFIGRFQSHYPQANVLVFSDHGMADITRRIDLELEKRLGCVSHDTYVYFTDSTMLRVWCFDEAIRRKAHGMLEGVDFGTLLGEDQRREFGVVNPAFGDLIFVFNEGCTPCPSFAGGLRTKALHGYLPDNENQHGVLLSTVPLEKTAYRTIELFDFFKSTVLGDSSDRRGAI